MSEAIRKAVAEVAERGESARRMAADPVNLPMIRHWLEALGDGNPTYLDERIAPPAMAQVWTMFGLRGTRPPDDPLAAMTAILDEAGFTSVVATNCEQTYHRYLHVGEYVSVSSRLGAVAGPKRTALGEGWFVTTLSTWYVGEEPVAEMMFRVLKFRPEPRPATRAVLRPVISRDTEFFWDGTAAGELRIQRCGVCKALRHPPGPACPRCGALAPEYVVVAGRGEVYSYVVHHHPPVPGRELPFVVALVELAEGVRLLAELVGVPPQDVRIGLPVRISFVTVDDELTLPVWRPDGGGPCAPAARTAQGAEATPTRTELPELRIEVTPTFVVSTAIATRDYQDVHHDRDAAVARGSTGIFLNILTDTGLVQRFVTDWAGPDAVVRGISLKLGVPCYAGETLVLSGRVMAVEQDETVVEVVGRNGLGDHVTATVRVALP